MGIASQLGNFPNWDTLPNKETLPIYARLPIWKYFLHGQVTTS